LNRRLNSFLRSDAAAALLCVLLALLIFQRIALDGMILARGDIYTYFYPYWAARSAALAAGYIPLWSPDVFMGVPLLANSQIGTFYPPNWLLTPLLPPAAVTLSLLLHAAWAQFGVYQLGKRTLGLAALPALLAGAVYGMGGYLGAQIEHVNQYQALAWMPWLFLLYHPARSVRGVLLLGGALALQLLAGHPQTVFISLVGLGVYGVIRVFAAEKGENEDKDEDVTTETQRAQRKKRGPISCRGEQVVRPFASINLRSQTRLARQLGILIAAGVIAALLAAPQLVPTLELVASSNRSGGLTSQQAMAFSFNPFLIGRGLLPSYEGLVFGEYVAYVGVIALALAVIGAFSRPLRWPWLLLLVLAFAFALGLYNPLYWPLTNLPGFSFFRVPARWLALLALAAALLAGCGVQALLNERPRLRLLLPIFALIGGLVAASFLADRMAVDVIGPALPTGVTLLGWGVGLVVALVLIWRRHSAALLLIAVLVELFLAAQIMPHNQVVPPDVYSAPRFTISQLRAYTADQTPPGRFLSITPLEFDPGDVAALQARYAGLNMSELGTRIALVATKMREVIAPNLALVWGLPALDGFDGGLLPSDAYSAFTSLLLPPGAEPTSDGRLREMLALPECRGACIPEQRWLDLSNTRYLIVDKVGDLWHADVAYDMAFTRALAPDETLLITSQPFQATALDVLYTCAPDAAACAPAVVLDDGASLIAGETQAVAGFTLTRYRFAAPRTPERITLRAETTLTVRALTLVDTRTGAFVQLTLPPWEKLLSSDIKLYENTAVLPRAFVVGQAVSAPDDAAALTLLRDPAFDPRQTVVLTGDEGLAAEVQQLPSGEARVISYTAQRVEIAVNASAEGYLLLTDAYYPGWTATVDAVPAEIVRANILFRAVAVPAGESRVVFEYRPAWWPGVVIIGLAAWALWALALLVTRGIFQSPVRRSARHNAAAVTPSATG
jgi:hypothetical protein